MGDGGIFLSDFSQVISVSNYSQDKGSVRLPELHDASSHLDCPHQISLHGVKHNILKGLSSPFGPLSLVLKALQHDFGANDFHPRVLFLPGC